MRLWKRRGFGVGLHPATLFRAGEWGEAIIDAIGQARALVLIFSAHANDSSQIRREIERAVHKGIPIIPLRIEDTAPTRSLEYFIGNVHWLDALTPPIEAHLRRLVDSLKALLQIHPEPPAIAAPELVSSLPTKRTNRLPTGIALDCCSVARASVDPTIVGTLVLDSVADG